MGWRCPRLRLAFSSCGLLSIADASDEKSPIKTRVVTLLRLIVQLPNCCFYPSISFVSGACPEVPAEGSAFCFRILIFGVCSELAARNWKQILTIFMRVVALLWLLARFSHSALIPCGRF